MVITDDKDKMVYGFNKLSFDKLMMEEKIFDMPVIAKGKKSVHLHFFCPCYIGLDFCVTASFTAKPESQKPKVEVNQKDLDLNKQKNFMEVMNSLLLIDWVEGV